MHKLARYRRMAASGRCLVVCGMFVARRHFEAATSALAMLTATVERALAGPLAGGVTVRSRDGITAVLHCR